MQSARSWAQSCWITPHTRRLRSIFGAEDFSLDSHRRIYLRMMELAETGKPVDFVTLTEQLGQHKEIEAVGGVAYVTSLTDCRASRTLSST